MLMQLDVNTEVYPMSVGDKFTMVLAPTLSLDGTPDTGFYVQVIDFSLNFAFLAYILINISNVRVDCLQITYQTSLIESVVLRLFV